jgi:hypothetical protein
MTTQESIERVLAVLKGKKLKLSPMEELAVKALKEGGTLDRENGAVLGPDSYISLNPNFHGDAQHHGE